MRPLRLVWLVGMLLLVVVALQPETLFARITAAPGDDNWQDQFYLGGPDGSVKTIAVYGSNLFAAGYFNTAGKAVTHNVAQWDGAQWGTVGSPPIQGLCGFRCYIFGLTFSIHASLVDGSKYYLGGQFVNGVLEWDGTQWSAVGGGLGGPLDASILPCNFTVDALAVMGDDLIVAGCFYAPGTYTVVHLLRWDGTNWSALGSDVTGGSVNFLAVQGEDLYAAGDFTQAGNVPVNHIAKWNRTTNDWSAVGGDSGSYSHISRLALYQNNLLVSSWTSNGSVTDSKIAKWDGAQWSDFVLAPDATIGTMAVYSGELYVAGGFDAFDGQAITNLAIWNGSVWRGLAKQPDVGIAELAFDGDTIYISGGFEKIDGEFAFNVAKYDGADWSPLMIPNGQGVLGAIYALAAHGTDVYAGGSLSRVGAQQANGLARWDTVAHTWTPLGNATCASSNCTTFITALVFDGDTLYAGGTFSEIGGVVANNIAKWDGSAWHALGNGLPCCVQAVTVKDGNVYAAGNFSTINRWNGQHWSVIGTLKQRTHDSGVNALAFVGDLLYVGGTFNKIDTTPVKNLTVWDGANWSAVAGAPLYGVTGMDVHKTRLLLAAWSGVYRLKNNTLIRLGNYGYSADVTTKGNAIYQSGTADYPNVGAAVWQGDQWHSLGSGIYLETLNPSQPGGTANAVAVVGKHVFVGGTFEKAGNKPSNNFGEWLDPSPEQPLLTTPVTGQQLSSLHPTLKWQTVQDANSYRVQLRANKRQGRLLLDTSTSETQQVTPGLKKDQTYFWRVSSCNGEYCSRWTPYWSFTIKP